MKNNTLPAVLVGILFLSAVLTAVFAFQYVFKARDLRRLQVQAANINNNRVVVQALANDVVEYSKRNPAINPLLQQFNINPGTGATAQPKPATR